MDENHCKKLLGRMADYLDGDLQPELCSRLEQHIRDCPSCRVVLDTLQKTISLYHQEASQEHMPRGMKQHLYQELKLEEYFQGGEH